MGSLLFCGEQLLGNFEVPGYVHCYGMHTTTPEGKPVILGTHDILTNKRTLEMLTDQGYDIVPVTWPNNPETPDPTDQHVWLLVKPIQGDGAVSTGTIMSFWDQELAEAAANHQSEYSTEEVLHIFTYLYNQLWQVVNELKSKTLRIRSTFMNTINPHVPGMWVTDANLIMQYQNITNYPVYTTSSKPITDETSSICLSIPEYSTLRSIYQWSADMIAQSEAVEEQILGGDTDEATMPTSEFNLGASASVAAGPTTFSALRTQINDGHFQVSKGFPYFDSYCWKEIANQLNQAVNAQFILGSHDNNLLPIQPNEQHYFEGLCDLIRYGVQCEQGLYRTEEIDSALQNNAHSVIVDSYLKDVAKMAYTLNWRHTGHCAENVLVSSEEGDGMDYGMELSGLYVIDTKKSPPAKIPMDEGILQQLHRDQLLFDGFFTLSAFVDNYGWGPYCWADMCIKLLRFGQRKPAMLALPGKDSTAEEQKYVFFDLNECVTTELNGDRNSWTLVRLPDGADYELGSVIIVETTPKCADDLRRAGITAPLTPMQLPIGVVLTRSYLEQEIPESTFVDMLMFVDILYRGVYKVSGVHYDRTSNIIHIDDDRTIAVAKSSDTDGYGVFNFGEVNALLDTQNILMVNMPNPILQNLYKTYLTREQNKQSAWDVRRESVFSLFSHFLLQPSLDRMIDLYNYANMPSATEAKLLQQAYTQELASNRAAAVRTAAAITLSEMIVDAYQRLYEGNNNVDSWSLEYVLSAFLNAQAGRLTTKRGPQGAAMKSSAEIIEGERNAAFHRLYNEAIKRHNANPGSVGWYVVYNEAGETIGHLFNFKVASTGTPYMGLWADSAIEIPANAKPKKVGLTLLRTQARASYAKAAKLRIVSKFYTQFLTVPDQRLYSELDLLETED